MRFETKILHAMRKLSNDEDLEQVFATYKKTILTFLRPLEPYVDDDDYAVCEALTSEGRQWGVRTLMVTRMRFISLAVGNNSHNVSSCSFNLKFFTGFRVSISDESNVSDVTVNFLNDSHYNFFAPAWHNQKIFALLALAGRMSDELRS